MSVTDDDLVLDGNAAAGLLHEIFVSNPTVAHAECRACGCVSAVGSLRAYAAPMGFILRCASCSNLVMSVASTPHGRWLEMSGARSVRF